MNTKLCSMLLSFVVLSGSASAQWVKIRDVPNPDSPAPAFNQCQCGYVFGSAIAQSNGALGFAQGKALDRNQNASNLNVAADGLYEEVWSYNQYSPTKRGWARAISRSQYRGFIVVGHPRAGMALYGFTTVTSNLFGISSLAIADLQLETSTGLVFGLDISVPGISIPVGIMGTQGSMQSIARYGQNAASGEDCASTVSITRRVKLNVDLEADTPWYEINSAWVAGRVSAQNDTQVQLAECIGDAPPVISFPDPIQDIVPNPPLGGGYFEVPVEHPDPDGTPPINDGTPTEECPADPVHGGGGGGN